MAVPELSVVVPSHFRPLRLRWLLNALEAQGLDGSLWEVIVGHDAGPETSAVLASHGLAAAGRLREAVSPVPVGQSVPGLNRNSAWRLARGTHVVFTDDDCFPPSDWLARVRAAIARRPEAVIQGPVHADPAEQAMLRSPYPRTQHFDDVPRPWGETANIVYPRALLESLGGFLEDLLICEDTDLVMRAVAAGAPYVGDATMWTNHAIDEAGLLDQLRGARRWAGLAEYTRRVPQYRELLFARVFWKESHFRLLVALAGGGLAVSTRRPAGFLLLAPWIAARPFRGGGLRGRLRHLSELPGWALIDLAEIAVLARASVAARTPVL